MRSLHVPHSALPGTTTLLADYVYRFEHVARFYGHNPGEEGALRRAALNVQMDDNHRQKLVEALRRTNGDSAALAQLELPGTVAVVTGQQVGLFSGPAYTVYKALTAARLARRLNDAGIRAVPVFWLATEDHDFAEVDHAWVFNSRQQPVKLTASGRERAGQPVGTIEIEHAPLSELAGALKGLMYADEAVGLVETCYTPGRTFGEAFRLLLEQLLSGYGFVFVDPLEPKLRQLAAPLLERAYAKNDELVTALTARGKALTEAGYHTQVLVEPASTLFFELRDGLRRRLKRGDEARDGAALSPNALLRPVMQDTLLPTAAYVGGPAEVAYFAQSAVLYKALDVPMPLVALRSGFTLLDARAQALLERFDLGLTECLHGEARLREQVAARLVPEKLQLAFEDARVEVSGVLDRLYGTVHEFDPTLGEALKRSRAKMLYQVEKNRGKAAREALRRDTRAGDVAAWLTNLIYPERHLQERLYTILPFLARHGMDLPDTLDAHSSSDHIVLTP